MVENTNQPALFCESPEEALREAVKALGGAKKVGEKLRPDMLADDAGKWLSDCLNTDRREKLGLGQILWILREARKTNYHGAINYICGDTGYGCPAPIEPEDEKAKLMRDFISATEQQTRNVKRMEELARLGIGVAP
jgi:hypothetical protein